MAQSTTQSRGIRLPPVTVTANSIVDQIRAVAFSGTSAGATESQLRDQNAFDLAAAQRRTPGVQISRYNPVGPSAATRRRLYPRYGGQPFRE